MRSPGKTVLIVAAGLGWNLAMASPGSAQAWLPPKGEAWFSLSYSNTYVRDHYWSDGNGRGHIEDNGHIRSNIVLADLGYSVTDRLAVKVNLPYVSSKYNGENAHLLSIDDGSYHGTFQDFRFEARYNAVKEPVVLTPFVAVILPSHHYEYFGHAVNGIDLKQFLVGTAFGRRLDPLLPRAYVQGRYSYAFAEKKLGISHNRSNLDLQIGYFIKPSFQLFALGMGQLTHGGLELNRAVIKATWTAADFHHHVQLPRSELLAFGGGADFQVTSSVDLSADFLATVAGRNDHAVNSEITLGVTLGFSPRQVLRRLTQPASPPPEPGS
jgi:hypothetical protein